MNLVDRVTARSAINTQMSAPSAWDLLDKGKYRDERDAMTVEQIDESDEIQKRSSYSIELVDKHDVYQAELHVSQQLLQCGSV